MGNFFKKEKDIRFLKGGWPTFSINGERTLDFFSVCVYVVALPAGR